MQENEMEKMFKSVVLAVLMATLLLAPLAGCTPFHGIGHGIGHGGHGILHH